MAKLMVVAVRDSAVQAFNRPFFVPALGMAIRSFTDEVNRKGDDNPMSRHPDDFELWYLGMFDEEAGSFGIPEGDGMRLLCRAKDLVQA